MRMSEAVLRGSKDFPDLPVCADQYFLFTDGGPSAACALGRAYLAIKDDGDGYHAEDIDSALEDEWPWSRVSLGWSLTACEAVIQANDRGVSLDIIARWLDLVENEVQRRAKERYING